MDQGHPQSTKPAPELFVWGFAPPDSELVPKEGPLGEGYVYDVLNAKQMTKRTGYTLKKKRKEMLEDLSPAEREEWARNLARLGG